MSRSLAPAAAPPEVRPAALGPEGEAILFGVGLILSLAILAGTGGRLLWGEHGGGAAAATARTLLGLLALLGAARWTVLFSLSFAARLRHRRLRGGEEPGDLPFVSIFVPCFNEGETIGPALESLLALDYPAYEVVVVNDGSTDGTLAEARRYEGRHGRRVVKVYDKPNGGKWSAHNWAFQRSRGELILCVDADSRLEPDSLRRLVRHMADPAIDGVAGQIRVRNRVNLITRLQTLEYLMGNGAARMGQGLSEAVLVVPGPIGLFRRSALEEVCLTARPTAGGHGPPVIGPFEGDTFAEDFDLSMAILCRGGRIAYEPEAISRTKAPADHFTLVNQRYRWTRGSMQVLRKAARRAWADPASFPPRLVAWIAATYVPDLLVMPFAYCLGLGSFLLLLASGGNPLDLAGWSAAFLLVQAAAAAFFASVHRDRLSVLAVLPLYGVYNGFVLNSAWAISVLDELRGGRMRW